jgi:threonine dehydratase
VKREAVLAYGAEVTACENTPDARAATLAEVIARTGATEIHPYDDDLVIAGAGTAASELLEEVPDLDVLVAPVGGGGLLSGTAIATHGVNRAVRVLAGEPELADDAARSLATGERQPPRPPKTIADGLLTGLSDRTFAIVREHVDAIVTVGEAEIVDAMQATWRYTKQVVEPSAAVAVAAVRKHDLAGARTGIILSGGNLDLDAMFATLR